MLESTSLVLAYGLDLWFTREAPSKTFDVLSEDFSKGTLLATILGLILSILITKPMVCVRKLNLYFILILKFNFIIPFFFLLIGKKKASKCKMVLIFPLE